LQPTLCSTVLPQDSFNPTIDTGDGARKIWHKETYESTMDSYEMKAQFMNPRKDTAIRLAEQCTHWNAQA